MADKQYMGTFHSVDNVLYKITELEAQGYQKRHICAVSNVRDDLKILESDSEIEIIGIREGSLWDHTRRLFNSKDELLTIFIKMGFSKQEAKTFYNDLKEGGIALFVDHLTDEERASTIDPHDSAESLEGESNEEAGNPIPNSPRIDTNNL
ncbi:general stress protein [Sporosarcina sp. GW1-11]|uniref:general stress protein n=1 Tax=Sporosarcina sp. GW1-11 TaxID=2899126 RepID=UPI00294FD0EC|nr:general stress protein [Sporosarcina sp. GW1-11]MDV6379405.1 general stress protein [Sporosarcina sp. GW1-11]